jgi:hypothetical protein
MSHLGNVIRGIVSTCQTNSTKFFDKREDSSRFVTREEYDALKLLVLAMKSDLEEIKEKENGKNN